ncbi:hypothetical protein [Bradyrhizobium sp. 141]|uniref:hypothetical protein n=1 Tax=Bradyrhizobium sp. 141 TaxID=2782617 RepID=UPI001FFA77DC|nr:hypothetical protein [Bradyrhizobium sp. 141]MCK1717866.1 hypothetical protein [Bradyrhizobium sp. 141]
MDEASDDDRTSAMGLLTDAKEMLAAARLLHESDVWKVQRPTYYLLGHSIEVALKSFLLANGISHGTLKKKLGHNLSKTARRVINSSSNSVSPVVEEYLAAIDLLNHYYQAKELEYRVTGTKTFPAKETLIAFLDAVIPKIEPIAYHALQSK